MGSCKSGCVGDCTTQDTCHIGYRHAASVSQTKSHRCSQQDVDGTDGIESNAFALECRKETWADLQADLIDEDYQSEALGKLQHLWVDGEAKASCHDTDKEDEGGAQ